MTAWAFTDDAFQNARLTPEILHKLRVPGRLYVLPPGNAVGHQGRCLDGVESGRKGFRDKLLLRGE
jgi:hypothetical protein